jgi:D-3-phosphoglycerate dehydrogenase
MGDIGLAGLDHSGSIAYEFFPEHFPEVTAEQIAGCDALISLAPRITAKTLDLADSRLSIIARFGVGYDMVDVQALTDHDVILTITPDGVRRPMASGIVSFILALSLNLRAKDRLIREERWKDRLNVKSMGLTGRVLGSVGLGNIGQEVFRLIKPFDMVHLGTDPYVKPEVAAELGVRMVDMETLLRESDFLCINCPLTPATRGLIGEREISLMKPSAYLINTSRGPIVNQGALYRALKEKQIRGAALDVFEIEPLRPGDPMLKLDNVILTPHSLCWTDECFFKMGQSAIESVLTVLKGEIPRHVVNPEVLGQAGTLKKLEANRARWNSAKQGK